MEKIIKANPGDADAPAREAVAEAHDEAQVQAGTDNTSPAGAGMPVSSDQPGLWRHHRRGRYVTHGVGLRRGSAAKIRKKAMAEVKWLKEDAEVEAEEAASKIRERAEEDARRIKEDAERQARKIINGARREAEEVASRAKREAEAQADSLLEDAREQVQEIISKARIDAEEEARRKSARILQQAKQKAIEIESEAVNEVMQAKIQATENIDKYLARRIMKVRRQIDDEAQKKRGQAAGEIQFNEQPLMDYLFGIEEVLTGGSSTIDCAAAERFPASAHERSSPDQPDIAGAEGETARTTLEDEAQSKELKETARGQVQGIIDEARSSEVVAEAVKEDGEERENQEAGVWNQGFISELQSEPAFEQELAELFEGKVEIAIAPPINVARLLGVTRHLENVLDIKILQTSGSWNTGSVISVSLDRPLPLIELLKDIPNVKGVQALDEQDQSTWNPKIKSLFASHAGPNRNRKILIDIGEASANKQRSTS